MAIIIPSSKIYSINNSKVRNNVIERIEVSANAPTLAREYNKQVMSEDYDTSNMWTLPSPTSTNVLSYYNYQTTSHSYYSASYAVRVLASGVLPIYKNLRFEIPKVIDNVFINNIKDGQINGVNNIKTTITYEYEWMRTSPTFEIQDVPAGESFNRYKLTSLIADIPIFNKGIESQELINLPTSFDLAGPGSAPVLSLSFPSDETNVSTAKVIYNSETDLYEVDLTVLCGLSYFKVAGGKNFTLDSEQFPISCDYFTMSGGYPTKIANNLGYGTVTSGIIKNYKPLSLNVAFYGNTIELNLKEETLYINGETAKKVYSVERNELMQTTNYRGAEASLVEDFSKTQELYAKGKETATVRCSIGDYYDTENGLTITPKTDSKMTFEIGDKVVPMVRNSKGQDNVLSSYSNGTAKVFNVVGEKYIYDGAVWQELTLRETGEGLYIYQTENPYLTFSSETDFTLSVYNQNKGWNGVIEYSTNALDWAVWNAETISSVNGKLYVRGLGNTRIGMNTLNYNNWILNGTDIHCYGNIETLLDYKAVQNNIHPPMGAYCFGYLFAKNDSLITPPSLPSTQLSRGCYYAMFSWCSNLTTLPLLPATNLAEGCYSYMFNYCSKIAISETQTSTYNKPYRIPLVGNGTATGDVATGMFTQTTTNLGTPEINTTYYTSNELV